MWRALAARRDSLPDAKPVEAKPVDAKNDEPSKDDVGEEPKSEAVAD
jgi:hypothetical protein